MGRGVRMKRWGWNDDFAWWYCIAWDEWTGTGRRSWCMDGWQGRYIPFVTT